MPDEEPDLAKVAALLVADGLVEVTDDSRPSGLVITQKGYSKGYEIWKGLSDEDKLLLALFLRNVKLI